MGGDRCNLEDSRGSFPGEAVDRGVGDAGIAASFVMEVEIDVGTEESRSGDDSGGHDASYLRDGMCSSSLLDYLLRVRRTPQSRHQADHEAFDPGAHLVDVEAPLSKTTSPR
jgi:hypothetical protein